MEGKTLIKLKEKWKGLNTRSPAGPQSPSPPEEATGSPQLSYSPLRHVLHTALTPPRKVTNCHFKVPLAFDSAPPGKESVSFNLGLLETSYSYTAVMFPDLQASRGGSELCFTDTKNPPGVTDTT